MKKIIALFLLLSFLLISFCGCGSKSNPESDFEYTVNEDQDGIFINKYVGISESVVIPSKINGLPVISLAGIPQEDNLTSVNEGVFEGTKVKTVVIPKSVQVIGVSAFNGCENLIQVEFSKRSELTHIYEMAFAGCVNLEKIDLSASKLKTIGDFGFLNCTKLKEISFPNTLEEIGERTFYDCSALLEVVLPESLTLVQGSAFSHCTSLKRIVIPSQLNLNFFSESMLNNVPAIKQIVFEEGREKITGYAMIQTDADLEIIVPKSVTEFSPYVFLINPSTNIKITFLGNAPEITADDTSWFGSPTICYDPSTTGWDTFVWNGRFEMKPILD